MTVHVPHRWILCAAALLGVMAMSGCAMVTVKDVARPDYTTDRRADALSAGVLGSFSRESLSVVGLDPTQCQKEVATCIAAFQRAPGVDVETRLSTLAELWTQAAIANEAADKKLAAGQSDRTLDAWLESARYAYAYLFFAGRTPAQRALEDRLIQVRDYYNVAAEQAAARVFEQARQRIVDETVAGNIQMQTSGWKMTAKHEGLPLSGVPESLVAASTLGFQGMRSTYRRDGFGGELVMLMQPATITAVLDADQVATQDPDRPVFSEMPAVNATVILRFAGRSLEEVLTTRAVDLELYSPERTRGVTLEGQAVPLAGNFTAAYALWLARSGFATQSIKTLFGRGEGIAEPHVYLMQPYDPQKRILFLLHGLASSPEAWVNLVNEVTGDRVLRDAFQIWSIYYPTNAPVALNRYTVSRAFRQTLSHFDPAGKATASQDLIFVGHSMGGILARLMVSDPGEHLIQLLDQRDLDVRRRVKAEARLAPLLRYSPESNVSRAIFIAAPHRGTDIAGNRLGRLLGRLVRLPLTLLGNFGDAVELLVAPAAVDAPSDKQTAPRLPTSLDNLKADDPFIRASAAVMPGADLPYHSIIARRDPGVPLAASNDGLVPYWSAHLDGASSEKVITSWHSVQETPEAVLEVRRILHEDLGSRAVETIPTVPPSSGDH